MKIGRLLTSILVLSVLLMGAPVTPVVAAKEAVSDSTVRAADSTTVVDALQVTGRVTDAATGDPIPGLAVRIAIEGDIAGSFSWTDADGYYSFNIDAHGYAWRIMFFPSDQGYPDLYAYDDYESPLFDSSDSPVVHNISLVGTPTDPTDPTDPDPSDPDPTDPDPLTVINVAGDSRYDTAMEASKLAYPDGLAEAGAKTVIIATGRNWPDALGGSALAGVLDGPILLVNTDSVPAAVLGEIARLGATGAIVVGGPAAVGPSVVSALEGAGLAVERIAGGSRYETADKVALRVIEEMDEDFDGTAFVATGGAYADAVAAAPLAAAKGWPLFLAHPARGLSEDTKAAMADVTSALVLGGELAVSGAVETGLAGDLGDENVDRLAGDSRYETAVAIAEHGVAHGELSWDRVGIATGQGYPDALAGGVLQGKVGSVMLLTRTAALPDETADALTANKAAISTVTYFGGELAVSQAVRGAVAGALGDASSDGDAPAVTKEAGSSACWIREAFAHDGVNYVVVDWIEIVEPEPWEDHTWEVKNDDPTLRTYVVPDTAEIALAYLGPDDWHQLSFADLRQGVDSGELTEEGYRIFDVVAGAEGHVVSLKEWWHP